MREIKYDNLKGILIILVVFAHLLITYEYLPLERYNLLINGIYLFHMPLFFIISGYFSRKHPGKNIIKYILLFLLMNSSFILYDYLKFGSTNIFLIKYSSWYILLLLLYRALVSSKTISNIINYKYTILFILIISITSGLCFTNINLVRLFSFFYFFCLGYRNRFTIDKKASYIALLSALCLYIFILMNTNSITFLELAAYESVKEIFYRTVLFIANTLFFMSITNLITNENIPFITACGRNSLYIYILHRIPVLLIGTTFYPYLGYILICILVTIIICHITNYLAEYLRKLLEPEILIPITIIFLILPIISSFQNNELTVQEQSKFNDAISLGFVGDLLLLEEQLKLSNDNFDYMFDNMTEYFQKTDYVFGVLEGPVDDQNDYSYGNYSDNKKLRLNYPTSFLKSIEKSGIDFVTIANNHLFDRGVKSHQNTIKNLDKSNLNYTGTKNNKKIVTVEGLKIGILAYTYGINYLNNEDYEEYTNFLVDPNSKEFESKKEEIRKDFQALREENIDLIIVFPHYGTEFNYQKDSYQEIWNRFFITEGANIIFGDHSHVIEPIEYKNGSIIINSPGNYVNSYIGNNSDISMYVKVFIDKSNHKIIGSSVTPIIATKDEEGKYYPETLENTKNPERVKEIFADTIFKNKLIETNNTYYYLPNKKYKIENKFNLELTKEDKNSKVFQMIQDADRICFVGDSITEGTKNNFNPWYLPLMSYFDKEIIDFAKGSFTSQDIVDNFKDLMKTAHCDLSIINIGTNDIRYNKTPVEDYIKNINKIINYSNSEIILIAPWQTTENDYNIAKNDTEKRELYNIYNEELKKINNAYYVDPNEYIKAAIKHNGEKTYLIDGVHPNDYEGIKLYSFAVLRG